MSLARQAALHHASRRLRLLQPASTAQTTAAITLWMSIYLPRLSIQAVTKNQEAAIVMESQAGRLLIISSNQAAEALAISNGMTVSAALSLCDGLHLYERDTAAECQVLNKVAALAYCFSSKVSLYATDTIVLEISGSLKLFGGLVALQQALQQQIKELQLQADLSIAPTARAAVWLALYARMAQITDLQALKASLRPLPIGLIATNAKAIRQFQNCGIQTLGDYMRLPRKDVNRRFGLQALTLLQQALGECPEPLQYHSPPQPFTAEWHFEDPVTTCELIERISEHLLQKLQRYLQARCAAIQHIVLLLEHTDRSVSKLRVGSSHYQRNDKHLKMLLHERLHNFMLKQPVMSVCLNASELHVLPPASMDLFAVHNNNQQDWQQLLDILQLRLGCQAIKLLSSSDDPRPEHAYQFKVKTKATQTSHPGWPFWLLETPQRLSDIKFTESLKPEISAERIEQGWWAGTDIRRDYYPVKHTQGARYWVFQDCRSKQWFLHGLFG